MASFSTVFLLLSLVCLASPCAAQRVICEAPPCTASSQVKTTPTNRASHVRLPEGVTGAESLAFDSSNRGPFTGVSDGRVLKWGGDSAGWTTFAYSPNYRSSPTCAASSEETESTCGRPLGLAFHLKTGILYFADAYKGLMRVGPRGGQADVLATEADGVPFNYLNGVDVDQDTGDVYFTDSSTTITRRYQENIMRNRDATARLMKYDAKTKQVTVLKDRLPYANGVAVSHDGRYLVVAHTGPAQVFRYWLKGAKAGQYELFADLPGYPDNVRRDAKGGYWVGLNREKITFNVPAAAAAASPAKHLVGVRLNGDGVEVEELTAASRAVTLSEVVERDRKLWLGSVDLDYVGLLQ
ncbi:hypothetical protein EE612_044568 [Oryza sativa]|uniref:Strictosidine synthase conserved region domain-containing protein n=2 Tax=Oryza TaxID=4527 RepID=A0A0E0ICK1_ORYNI|nr:hypothetical protein OsI_29389 [Oryza sativa Indica Group]KAB8108686.1 hypothetical protein EE612_044568 [Oryza sativa]